MQPRFLRSVCPFRALVARSPRAACTYPLPPPHPPFPPPNNETRMTSVGFLSLLNLLWYGTPRLARARVMHGWFLTLNLDWHFFFVNNPLPGPSLTQICARPDLFEKSTTYATDLRRCSNQTRRTGAAAWRYVGAQHQTDSWCKGAFDPSIPVNSVWWSSLRHTTRAT